MAGPMTTLALARGAVCGACIAGALAAGVPAAHGWTSPEAISVNADAKAFAVAGDPAGNAFAVVAGGTLDEPLLLVERTAVTQFTPKSIFTWGAPQPFPGGAPKWTVPGAQVGAAGAAAAGIGAGVIAVREDRKGGSLTRALARDPGGSFTDPVTILGAPYSPMTRPALDVADGGLAVVAVGTTARARWPSRGCRAGLRRRLFRAGKPRCRGRAGAPLVAWVSGTGHSPHASTRTGTSGARSSSAPHGAGRRSPPRRAGPAAASSSGKAPTGASASRVGQGAAGCRRRSGSARPPRIARGTSRPRSTASAARSRYGARAPAQASASRPRRAPAA